MLRYVLLLLLVTGQSQGADNFDSLLKDLDRERELAGVAGGAVIIVDANQVRHAAGFGITHWDDPKPMHPDAWVRIGSVTKSFVGLAFLRADQQGVVPLNANLSDLNAEQWVNNPWRAQQPVTIEQLLEHSAGLTDMVREEWDHNIPLPLAQALSVAPHSRTLNWPAGLHSSYSNSGAGVAALAAEHGLKQDFEKYLTEQILRPMGMAKATFSASVQPQLIGGYDSDGRTPIRYWHVLYRPFGGLNLPFSELGRFLQMLLGRGTLDGKALFSPAQITRMENPATTAAAQSGLAFGYGLGNYHQVHKGFVFHGHGGDADGYLTHCAYSRDAKLGFCLMINAFQGSTLRAMKRRVMDYIVDGLSPSFQAGVPQPMAHLQALTGRYQEVTYRFPGRQSANTLVIALRSGRLWLERNGTHQHLVPVSYTHLTLPTTPYV